MTGIEQGTIVTLAMFVAGLIWHAGRMSQRVDDLQRQVKDMAKDLRADIGDLKGLLRAVISEGRALRDEPPRVRNRYDDK